MTFDEWFSRLLSVNAAHGEYGLEYPTGACCYRDVLRATKPALREAWNRIIEGGEEPT